MQSIRIRDRSWRFYRNWLVYMLLWAALLLVILGALRNPLPLYLYVLLAIPAYYLGSSIYYAYRLSHPGGRFLMRKVTPADAGMDYEKVEFQSRDGLTLFGWYVPGENGATIILVHGHGSKGIAMVYHASALAAKGYGVLMFDLRAHGSSDGDTCTYGWEEVNDLFGAVDYLKSRPDVDPGVIGALGISLGGQVVLRAAAQSMDLKAVVAEGPNAAILEDHGGRPTTLRRWINYPLNWLHYKMVAFMNGAKPPAGILTEISKISPRPVLLISTGKGGERYFTRMFFEAAADPKDLWEILDAGHGGGYFKDPEAYQKKIVEHFDVALLGGKQTERGGTEGLNAVR
jgi:pimeloyl-ACP methyl ester carboxylesterase